MIILYTITALFIAWIWVDYYRLVDLYEIEELKYFVLVFVLGAASTEVTIGVNRLILDAYQLQLDGNLLNDFLYATLKVGMLEEFSKAIPLVVMLLLFKKQVNEPIDYLSYICVSALGFSAAENIMYFDRFGAEIISGRSILSSLGHMMFAAFTGYGIVLYKFKKTRYGLWIIPIFFLFASLSHGIYDFWLMHYPARLFGYFITILFFLQSVSIFAVMLNNALNNSEFFTFKKVIDSGRVANRLLGYYFVVFILQFAIITFSSNIQNAFASIGFDTFLVAFIILVCCLRLSRFKLIPKRWFVLKLEMPFHYRKVTLYKGDSTRRQFAIKGEAYNEVYLNNYYNENLWLNPLSKRKSYLKTSKKAFIEKKIFLHNDESYYVTKLFLDSSLTRFEYVLLKPKLNGKSFTAKNSPIVAVLRTKDLMNLEDTRLRMEDFRFVEWAYPKVFESWEQKA